MTAAAAQTLFFFPLAELYRRVIDRQGVVKGSVHRQKKRHYTLPADDSGESCAENVAFSRKTNVESVSA